MSYALRVADASFARDGEALVAPFSLVLADGDDASIDAPNARAATIVARMCAAIVKPTVGTIYVGDFETRLQPPQAKRLVGYVDAAGFTGDDHAFRCEIAFRADVWGLDHRAATARAQDVVAALAFVANEGFARAAALALVADVRLVVLDRPPTKASQAIRALVPQAGILRVTCAQLAASPRPAAIGSAR